LDDYFGTAAVFKQLQRLIGKMFVVRAAFIVKKTNLNFSSPDFTFISVRS
jgi:hypothetical protein